MSDTVSVLYESLLARLALLNPVSDRALLIRALDTYLDGKPIELIERCELPRQRVKDALAAYQTRRGRLRALDRLLSEMGVPE